jgi:hypothetical protein
VPFTVPLIILHYQKEQVKKEVKKMIIAGMNKKDLVLLTFSLEEKDTDLSWHHSREFEFEGEMYDIVESEVHGDSVSYWCWHDKEEMKIRKQIDDFAASALSSDPQKKEQQQRVVNLLKLQYLSCGYSWELLPDLSGNLTFPDHPSDYISVSFQPPSPPPKIS